MTPHISNLYVDLAGNVPSIVLPSRVQTYQSDLLLCQTDDKDHGYSFKPKNEWNRQPCQSAFIKKRPILDNFIYVQSQAKLFPQSKTPLLLKLDVEKALDTVSWDSWRFSQLVASPFVGATLSLSYSRLRNIPPGVDQWLPDRNNSSPARYATGRSSPAAALWYCHGYSS
jgi:hypothetical protein